VQVADLLAIHEAPSCYRERRARLRDVYVSGQERLRSDSGAKIFKKWKGGRERERERETTWKKTESGGVRHESVSSTLSSFPSVRGCCSSVCVHETRRNWRNGRVPCNPYHFGDFLGQKLSLPVCVRYFGANGFSILRWPRLLQRMFDDRTACE
jgi:hypothetical protein